MATEIGSPAIPTNRPTIAILHLPHLIHSLHSHGREVYLKQTDNMIIVCNHLLYGFMRHEEIVILTSKSFNHHLHVKNGNSPK